jgi:hypothetical protein
MPGPRLGTIVLALSLAAPAAADPVAWTIVHGGIDGWQLAVLDLETGEAVEIGGLEIPDLVAGRLALDPSGTLYTIDWIQTRLLSVDTATGAATVVGELGIPPFSISGFTADACGRLWLAGTETGRVTDLYQVDPATGQATLVTSLDPPIQGLVARGEEILALSTGPEARVVRIDPATGTTAEVLPLSGFSQIAPTALDRSSEGDLWGFGAVLVPIDPLPSVTFRILPDGSREITHFGYFHYNGLAISPPAGFCGPGAPPAIPAVSPLGLIALAVALGAAGLWLRRRRGPRPDLGLRFG